MNRRTLGRLPSLSAVRLRSGAQATRCFGAAVEQASIVELLQTLVSGGVCPVSTSKSPSHGGRERRRVPRLKR